MNEAASAPFFVVGGTLDMDTRSYIERESDMRLRNHLWNNEFCYVLVSRQMGKSSLMIRTAAHLQQEGIATVILDLNASGHALSCEQWYSGLLEQIARCLNIQVEIRAFWKQSSALSPLQRWLAALEHILTLLSPSRLVIFIDEIDHVQLLPFSMDEFFAGIRSCYSRRAEDNAFRRLTFCLLGTALPSDLIADYRLTPFNVGKRIELTDFTLEQVLTWKAELERGTGTEDALLERVHYWTNGHPYLTQSLCYAIAEDATINTPADVDDLCKRRFLSIDAQEQDDNLIQVRKRLLRSLEKERDVSSLLTLYDRIIAGKRIPNRKADALVGVLYLSGIVRPTGSALAVRNRIYEQVFDRQWVRKHMPGEEFRRQRKAVVLGALMGSIAVLIVAMICYLAYHYFQVSREALASLARMKTQRYVSQMYLIQQAWDAEPRDIDQVNSLLTNTASYPDKGEEWYYWHSQYNHYIEALNGHTGSVYAVDFSPNRKLAVTGSYDRTARIWDTRTGRSLLSLRDHTGPVYAVAFSHDGKRVVTGSYDHTAKIWDAHTGQTLLTLDGHSAQNGHSAQVYAVAFSPDDRHVATGSADATTKIWDTQTGQLLLTLNGHTGSVHAVAFSPDDGKWIVSGSYDGTARIWDASTGKLLQILSGQDEFVYTAAFSPDSARVVTGSRDGNATIWDARTGKPLQTLIGHSETVSAAAFSSKDRVITVSRNGTARIWDAKTGLSLGTLIRDHSSIYALSLSHDGKWLVTGSYDHTAKIWDAHTGKRLLTLIGQRTNTGSDDGTVSRWKDQPGQYVRPLTLNGDSVHVAAFSPDGRQVITGCPDNKAKIWKAIIWNAQTGQSLLTLKGNAGAGFAAAFSHESTRVITGSPDGTAKIWDAKNGRLLVTLKGYTGSVYVVAFSHNGKLVITGSVDGKARIWNAQTGQLLFPLNGHKRAVIAAAFSPDDQRIVTGSYDDTVRIWDTNTGNSLVKLNRVHDTINAVAFSWDSKQVITGSPSGTVEIWDANTGHPLQVFTNYYGSVFAVAFSPISRRVVTGSADGTAIIWDTETSQPLLTLKMGDWPIEVLAFSDNGDRLVTGNYGGIVGTCEFDQPSIHAPTTK